MSKYSIEDNKKLIEEYPFLLPRNRWTDKIPEDYDYSYTELDSMPDGWREAFGEFICRDIKNELLKISNKALDNFRIIDIKEKYGSLRFYCTETNREISMIIAKYEYLSQFICLECGKFEAHTFNYGWIFTLCDDCFKNLLKKQSNNSNYNIFKEKDEPLENEIIYEIYSNGKKETIHINLEDTIKEIRERISTWQ